MDVNLSNNSDFVNPLVSWGGNSNSVWGRCSAAANRIFSEVRNLFFWRFVDPDFSRALSAHIKLQTPRMEEGKGTALTHDEEETSIKTLLQFAGIEREDQQKYYNSLCYCLTWASEQTESSNNIFIRAFYPIEAQNNGNTLSQEMNAKRDGLFSKRDELANSVRNLRKAIARVDQAGVRVFVFTAEREALESARQKFKATLSSL